MAVVVGKTTHQKNTERLLKNQHHTVERSSCNFISGGIFFMRITRLDNNPIIKPDMDDRMGSNINGPSLIRVPDWIEEPLSKYYLYFANHGGKYIRLAYAAHLEGPWSIYTPGTLQIDESFFTGHIASPDVHVDNESRQIRMYYHGNKDKKKSYPHQISRVAVSKDGINFNAFSEVIGRSYMRVFQWNGYYYSIEMSGTIRRSEDGLSDFKEGPVLFEDHYVRHTAVKLVDNILYVFFTRKEDKPERILLSKIDLTPDWLEWTESPVETILQSEKDYEGGNLPLEASESGSIHKPVRQLRDPAIYEEGEDTYLLYSVAGEHGIAIAKIVL